MFTIILTWIINSSIWKLLILFHLTKMRFFNIHHMDWLTYSGETDRPDELYYNFSISNNLAQIVKFPTWIPGCDSSSPALLDLFISSDTSICSTMALPPLGNSVHVVVSVSIDFSINSKQDPSFHCVAYDYPCADWDGLCDICKMFHWRKFLESVLLLLLVNFVKSFRLELMYISPIVSIRSSLNHLCGFQQLVLQL